MLDAMFSMDPAKWNDWLASQGHEPFDDRPACLALIPKNEWMENTKVVTLPAIQKYLDSDDILTDHTIDMMELATEKAYGVTEPWYVTSIREGTEEEGDLSVKYFYLGKES